MNLVGERFGRLVVTNYSGEIKGKPQWRCACDCGAVVITKQEYLRCGDTKSCGCLKRDTTIARNTSHGLTGTYTYKKWAGMWHRVRNPINKSACYTGVTICKKWRKYENFLSDMGESPLGYSLDRIDNKKGYSKSNCRWVPLQDQSRNTSRVKHVVVDGVSMCLSEAARINGLSPDLVLDRINYLGWAVEKALNTPKRALRRKQK